MGGSARSFLERLNFRALFPIYDQANITGHHTSLDIFSILGRESCNLTRSIKEAMYIRANDPSLNRNTGSTSCPTYGMRSHLIPQNSQLK